MTGIGIAELALQALMDCHSEAKQLASNVTDHSYHFHVGEGHADAVQIAAVACTIRDTIAQRIALIQLEIASAIAERESELKTLH